jgi:hypothetical protein
VQRKFYLSKDYYPGRKELLDVAKELLFEKQHTFVTLVAGLHLYRLATL